MRLRDGAGMTLQEAAATLGLSPVTLRVQIRNGKLRAVKRGRDWHVTPGEVERYRRDSLTVQDMHRRCTNRSCIAGCREEITR